MKNINEEITDKVYEIKKKKHEKEINKKLVENHLKGVFFIILEVLLFFICSLFFVGLALRLPIVALLLICSFVVVYIFNRRNV